MRSDVLSVSVCFSTFFVGVLCFNMEKHTTDQRCEHTQTQTTTLKSTMMKQFNSILAVVVAAAVSSHAFAPPQSITVPRTMTTTLSMSAVSVGQSQVLPAGVQKMVTKPGNGFFVKDGDVATVRYSCSIPNGIVFSKSDRQQVIVGEGSMIDGWDAVLPTMTIGEKATVRITDPTLAYGPQGIPPLIPPNAEIEIDLEVLDAEKQQTINLEDIMYNPNTPRTAGEIAAAYDKMMADKALEPPKKEGLEGLLEEAKGWYFFGLFEGETGEEAPWYLKPSITFPIAFAIVGATFYVCLAGGAIAERGAQVKDELDEVILTLNGNSPSSAYAAAVMATAFVRDIGL